MPESDPLPTFTIGVGQAGIEILETFQSLVPEEEGDYFDFLAIDSNFAELNNCSIEKIQHLETPQQFTREYRRRYPYLTQDMDIGNKGAERQRPVGRYKLDNPEATFSDHFYNIEDHIRRFRERHETRQERGDQHINLFLVHSLGGGTGSGTFPLVSAILHYLAEKIRDDHDLFVYNAAVGVIPKLDFAYGIRELPGDDRRYYPNTYASLRDLEKLLSADEGSPLRLPVHARRDIKEEYQTTHEAIEEAKSENAFEFRTPPFNDYFLVGIDEDRIKGERESPRGESYSEVIDKTVAKGLYTIARFGVDMENISGRSDPSKLVATMSQKEVAVPYDRLKDYCETKQQISRLEELLYATQAGEEIDDSRGVEQIIQNPELVVETLGEDTSPEEVEEELENLVGTELGEGINLVSNTPEDIEELLQRVQDSFDLRFLPLVVRRIEEQLDEIAQTIKQDRQDVVEGCWEDNRMESLPDYGGAETVGGKAANLEDYLEEEIDRLEENLEMTSPSTSDRLWFVSGGPKDILTGKRERLRENLEFARTDLDDLRMVEQQYESFQSLKEKIDTERRTVEERLRNARSDLGDARDTLAHQAEELASAKGGGRRVSHMPLQPEKLDSLTLDTLENNLNSIRDFIENGYIDRDEFQSALVAQVERTPASEKPIVRPASEIDRELMRAWNSYGGHDTNLYVLYSEENEDEVDLSRAAVNETPQRPDDAIGYIDDPYRVGFVSTVRCGPLPTLRIFQELKEYADKGDLDSMVPQWGNDHRKAFAYPEWYERDIQRAFSVIQEKELTKPPELEFEKVNVLTPDESGEEPDITAEDAIANYLYWGKKWGAYEAPEIDFSGWESDLDELNWDQTDLEDLLPSADVISRWIEGELEWESLLEEIRENAQKIEGIRIQFREGQDVIQD